MATKEQLYQSLIELQKENKKAELEYQHCLIQAEEILATPRKKLEEAKKRVESTSLALKELILKDLEENGEIPQLTGVNITHTNKIIYDERDAITYAIYNNWEEVLSIKKAPFNESIKKMDSLPEFVSLERIPTIAISTDINMAIYREIEGKATVEKMLPKGLKE